MVIVAITITLVLSISEAPIVVAQPDKVAEQADPDAQIRALLKEHEESDLGYVESYKKFRPRFEEFAESHRGTEAEVRAILWLVQESWWLRQDGKMEETSVPLAEDLLKRHADSPQLDLLVEYQYVFNREQRQQLFNRLLEVSSHRSVKAAAHFGLARLESARGSSGEPNEHFKALVDEFADVKWRSTTFGTIANAYLNPHSPDDLAVGSEAPEILGVDHKGQPMRLSDFRGKVVLLDFWGHW